MKYQVLFSSKDKSNKSTACGCQHLAVAAFKKKSKSKKGHNFVKKIEGLPPLLVWVPLLIVNNYSEFQVHIFSNNRNIRKCQKFHTTPDNNNAAANARAMTIPQRFHLKTAEQKIKCHLLQFLFGALRVKPRYRLHTT